VNVNYTGKSITGEKFDSNVGGQPAKFPVTGVIRGWTQALLQMPVGSKWELFIPAELAFGEQGSGQGGKIKPNETLIFEVELLSIEPKTAPAKVEPVKTVPVKKLKR
jgi:FKBP-type peptidyl-prolyl cis-trans isomerase FklB